MKGIPTGRIVMLFEHPDGFVMAVDGVASAELTRELLPPRSLAEYGDRPRYRTSMVVEYEPDEPIRFYRTTRPPTAPDDVTPIKNVKELEP